MLRKLLILVVSVFVIGGCATTGVKEVSIPEETQVATHLTKEGVKFIYSGTAGSVFVAGSFNNWSTSSDAMKKIGADRWVRTISLPQGKHSYKFVVDGNWTHDINNPNVEPDGFGGQNSVINVAAPEVPRVEVGEIKSAVAPRQSDGRVLFSYKDPAASSVFVAGEFNNWSTSRSPMVKNRHGVFTAEINLSPGSYQYKFVVDGNWLPDPNNPKTTEDGFGGENSVIDVK